ARANGAVGDRSGGPIHHVLERNRTAAARSPRMLLGAPRRRSTSNIGNFIAESAERGMNEPSVVRHGGSGDHPFIVLPLCALGDLGGDDIGDEGELAGCVWRAATRRGGAGDRR